MAFVEKSNRAVKAWQAGQEQEAASLLQATLTELLVRVNQRDENETMMPMAEKGSDIGSHCLPMSSTIKIFGGDRMVCSSGSKVSLLEVYTRPLLVGPTQDHCTENEENLLSAVVLFNMALAHHTQGLTLNQDESLPKADRLYQLSLKVAVKCMHAPDLLFLALYNNLAYIDCHFNRLTVMNESLEEMRFILVAHDVDDNVTSIHTNDLRLFFKNTKVEQEESGRAAAA